MQYLLNSAVLTSFGAYTYQPLTPLEAQNWLAAGSWHSTIGYAETAVALELLTGVPIPVNRETITMQSGDEALVFRIVLPPGSPRIDPTQKGHLQGHLDAGHWELGLLVRTA